MTKHYYLGIDALRILAILAVIMIHTTILSIQNVDHDITKVPFTFFLNQAAIFAVPLFFLISGFVLELHYKNLDYLTYFKKRASRIIIPYIFWSLFYYFAYPETVSKTASFFSLLLRGAAAYQLYFIPAIILFYLCFPLLHKFYGVFARKSVILSLITVEIFLQTMDYLYGPFNIGKALRVTLLSFVMFPLGMIASHHEVKIISFTKKYGKVILLLLFLVASIIIVEGWYYFQFSKNPQAIYSQYNAFVIPYTLLVALPVFYFYSYHEKYRWIITKLSRLSFFVFFIHVAMIYTFWKSFKPTFLQTQETLLGNILFPLGFFLFITILSFLIADLVHRIPKIKRITG